MRRNGAPPGRDRDSCDFSPKSDDSAKKCVQFSLGKETTEVPSFKSESHGVPITFASPRSREALLDFMAATIQAKDLRTCSILVICQQNEEARQVKSEMGNRDINTMLLEADQQATRQMVLLWSQGYIQQVFVACDDCLEMFEGLPVDFVIHTALPPVEKFKERLDRLTKSENKAEMLALITGAFKEETGILKKENGKAQNSVVKSLKNLENKEKASELVCSTRALTRGKGSVKDKPESLKESLPEEADLEGWQTPPEDQKVDYNHVGGSQCHMEALVQARSRLGKASSSSRSSTIDSARSTMASGRVGFARSQFGVLAWSRDLIVPCYDMSGVVDLNTTIQATMKTMLDGLGNGHQARGAQRYAWPHVSCGKSLVAVGPENIGKTWCYLPSLCQRTHEQMLLCTEEHYGPISIVVCFNQRNGNQILQWIIKLLNPLDPGGSQIPHDQVVYLWEKGNVQEVADRLSHSVGILVTTPDMLVLLKEWHTKEAPIFDLDSVKCLALDNLSGMMRRQPDTTAKMVDWIIQLLNFGPDGSQLFVTTRLWPGTLMQKSLLPLVPDVLIVFKDPLEATVYGGAGLEVNLIRPGEESRSLVQLLRDRTLSKERIVVMCHTKEEVLDLRHKLTRAGFRSEGIYDDGGLTTATQWRLQSLPLVLLVTDDMVDKVKCGPIDQLIHYTSPTSWTRFKFRFSLLYKNYVSSCPCKSVVLLQQSDFDRLWELADFIVWHQLPRPDHWLRVLSECRRLKDKPSSQLAKLSLCDQMSSYGDCFRRYCHYRHIMWREELQPPANYPGEGDFRFQVLNCYSPVQLAVRLNELYPTQFYFFSQPMSQLGQEVHVHYEVEENRRQHQKPKAGEIVIVRNLKRYERVVVIQAEDTKVTVRLLDNGIDRLAYKPSEIFVCEKRHQEPGQAMEVRLIGIEPDTLERTWSTDMRDAVRSDFFNQLQGKRMRIFSARVKCVLSRTIFVDTVVDDKGQDLRSFLLHRFHVHEEAMSMEKLRGVVNASQPRPKDF
ncbi:putative ATP-dependent RNA helicase BoYb isoform X2 [Drosophila kikkawai]|uniref:RNA helicase n=1 Tax=Drosophila kikkawai TaxID=30033 RepID=A0A6P4IJA2_DROKI|nr:putative ATP-dependent RNA helicase SoYb isoform X2 [Drosophila kikkawai]